MAGRKRITTSYIYQEVWRVLRKFLHLEYWTRPHTSIIVVKKSRTKNKLEKSSTWWAGYPSGFFSISKLMLKKTPIRTWSVSRTKVMPNGQPVLMYGRVTSMKSVSFYKTTCTLSLTNFTSLPLTQSRDCSDYISRPILAPPPLWLQKHSDLRAQEFAHSPETWHQGRFVCVTCVWSWRNCEINPCTYVYDAVYVLYDVSIKLWRDSLV